CERFFVTKRDMSFEENRPSRFKGRHRPKCPLAARGRSRQRNQTQAKPPAPPRLFNNLRTRWGRHFSLPDFCHGLLATVTQQPLRYGRGSERGFSEPRT